MKESSDNKNTTITFRTTDELKKKIEKLASKERRTLSNMIEVLLESAMKEKR